MVTASVVTASVAKRRLFLCNIDTMVLAYSVTGDWISCRFLASLHLLFEDPPQTSGSLTGDWISCRFVASLDLLFEDPPQTSGIE